MPELPPAKRCSVSPRPFPAASGDRSSGPGYAELHCRTNFSFLEGASHPDELAAQALQLGYAALAITDRNSLAGVVRAHVAAKEAGLKLLIGAEVTPVDAAPVLLWAMNRTGYGRLARLLTHGRRSAPKGQCRLTLSDVAAHAEGLLAGVLLRRAEPGRAEPREQSECERRELRPLTGLGSPLQRYADIFGDRCYAVAELHRGPDDERLLHWMIETARAAGVPIVAANDVHYHVPQRRPLQDVLTAIRHGCTVADLGRRIFPNAERHLKAPAAMSELFAGCPEAVANTLELAGRCRFSLDELRYEYPEELCPAGMTPMEFLTQLTWQGAEQRYEPAAQAREPAAQARVKHEPAAHTREPAAQARVAKESLACAAGSKRKRIPAKVRRLIEHELKLIAELRYEAYFLTVWDLVQFARGRDILCQGRGSAANSAVCFCLGITSVDPEQIDVLFERFVSKERDEAPDIDVDFEHERREEVLQYIYEKYGRDRAGMTAEVITYQVRSAVRDVGKALGLSPDRVDVLAKVMDHHSHDQDKLAARLSEAGFPVVAHEPAAQARETGEPNRVSGRSAHSAGEPNRVSGRSAHSAGEPNRVSGRSAHSAGEPNRVSGRSAAPHRPLTGLGSPEHTSSVGRHLVELVRQILGFPRHLSQHVGGMIITRGPLCELVPIENAAMAERTVVEWDKNDLDALGILKVDCLALGMLTAIHKCFDLILSGEEAIRKNGRLLLQGVSDGRGNSRRRAAKTRSHAERGNETPLSPCHPVTLSPCHSVTPLTLATVPTEDPAVYDMISRADTIGVFQIESRAQMSMLPRLKPNCFYDLVIEVAIVRPGPIQGDMVHPYLRRRAGQEAVDYPDERIKAVLEKTLGVPIFQEQAMRLAVVAAGFTPGEADQLRRAMGAWRRRGVMESFRLKLVNGMLANGYSAEFAERVFRQIQGFGEYGFPESHAASFALLVYVSAWLKLYHPAAFTCAVLNSQPMGFYAPAQLVADAKKHGVEVLPIDVNRSQWDCTLEEEVRDQRPEVRDQRSEIRSRRPEVVEKSLRLGFRLAHGLSPAQIAPIVEAERPFTSYADFVRRTGLRGAVLKRLAQADAFHSLGLGRRPALWQTLPGSRLAGNSGRSRSRLAEEACPLFANLDIEEPVPASLPHMAPLQEVLADYSSAGLSLRQHPMAFLRGELDKLGVQPAHKLAVLPTDVFVKVAGLVLLRQRPSTAKGITFVTLEDETGMANLIVRQNVWERYRRVARLANVMLVHGRLQREAGVIHVLATKLEDLSGTLSNLHSASRDFR